MIVVAELFSSVQAGPGMAKMGLNSVALVPKKTVAPIKRRSAPMLMRKASDESLGVLIAPTKTLFPACSLNWPTSSRPPMAS